MKRFWGLARRVGEDISVHNLSIIAAGMAYNAIFALFPGLAALVSIYGLFADPAAVTQQIDMLTRIAPKEVAGIIGDELSKLAGTSGSKLGLSLVVSVAVGLFSVGSGIKSLITGLNVAYDAKEHRGFFSLWLVALALAIGSVLAVVIALALVAVLPAVLSFLGAGGALAAGLLALRWPVLALLAVLGLGVFYRWGPCRLDARWRWITWGSGLSTALWVGGSALLSLYVANFGKYDQTYGSIGGAIVLLLWLYFSAFVILLGAEIDAELEQRHGVATSRESQKTARA